MVKCHDCGAEEGELHQIGCDMERCPTCQGSGVDHFRQAITCGCTHYVKDRIPWVQIPVLCRLCGTLWPDLFNLHNKEWNKYVPPNLQNKVLSLNSPFLLCKDSGTLNNLGVSDVAKSTLSQKFTFKYFKKPLILYSFFVSISTGIKKW